MLVYPIREPGNLGTEEVIMGTLQNDMNRDMEDISKLKSAGGINMEDMERYDHVSTTYHFFPFPFLSLLLFPS